MVFTTLLLYVEVKIHEKCYCLMKAMLSVGQKFRNLMQTLLNSVNGQTMIHRQIYSFESLFLHKKKEKVLKVFLLDTSACNYNLHKGFLGPLNNQIIGR